MKMNDQTIESEMLNAALDYERAGLSVILVAKNKQPLYPWKQFQERRATVDELRKLFAEHTEANIGIVTGSISGIVVVDVEKGGKIEDLPKTVCSQTGGGGYHFYYKYDPQQPIKNYTRIRELTDIRGDGGFVVAPISEHQSGNPYRWIVAPGELDFAEFPYWLLEDETVAASANGKKGETDWADFPSQEILEGRRNEAATKFAGKLLHDLSCDLWDTAGWSAMRDWNQKNCKPPLPEKELHDVWASIKKAQKTHEKKNPNKKGDNRKNIEIYGKRFKDGRIVEAYFDPTKEETGFLFYENGEVSKVESIVSDGKTFVPPPPHNALIAGGFVKLPSDAMDFESEEFLIMETQDFIYDYVQLSPEFEELTSYYVPLTWVYDEFKELPYVRALGDFGSGKSRLLKVMGSVCFRSIFLNGATSPSAIFRMIDDIRGTLVLDEGDFRHSDTTNELIKILNSGFQEGIPVFRSESTGNKNKAFDPTPFSVFCPKVLATRKNFSDEALESRCLSYAMETLTREDIPENLDGEFEKRALMLRNKWVMFRFRKLVQGVKLQRLPKMVIEPRLKQITTPIYSVLEDTGARQRVLEFIRKKQDALYEERFNSMEGEVLQSLLMLRETNAQSTMKEIADKYNDTFAGKYRISPKRVGNIIDQIFHLQKKKSSHGFYIVNDQGNDDQIRGLKVKFGIEKPEMNDVNVVNITSITTQ